MALKVDTDVRVRAYYEAHDDTVQFIQDGADGIKVITVTRLELAQLVGKVMNEIAVFDLSQR